MERIASAARTISVLDAGTCRAWRLAGHCALALIGACGDDDDDTAAPDGRIDAAATDAAAFDSGRDTAPDAGPASTIAWHDCELPFRCGTLPLPLDHADPAGPTIDVAFVRTIAQSPEDRLGLLMINPGGPGGSAIAFARFLAANADRIDPALLRRFDIVAFDPRGVGDSTQVDCVDDEALATLQSLDATADDEDEWTAAEEWVRGFVAGCEERSPELVRRVDSESAARDMDRLREALGEEQVSYWGISYGSVLGTTYATLFPDRVRAFVLDSPVAPAADLVELARRQVGAYEVELGRFFDYCGARGQCGFHGGEGADALGSAYDALLAAADLEPLPAGDGAVSETNLRGVVVSLLVKGDWDALDEALAEAEAGDATRMLAVVTASGPPLVEAAVPISLLDQGCPVAYTYEDVRAFLEGVRATASRAGIHSASQVVFCGVWPLERPTPRTALDVSAAPPMLVMAGEHDPATPFEGVEPFLAALGNASHLITWQGDGHGVALRNGCTTDALLEFLIDPSSPPREETCAR